MRRKFLLSWFLMLLLITGNSSILNAQVAKVGNTEYATIDEAIAAWTNNTTLTLLADVTLSDVIELSSTEYHILDLGTYTMTAASGKDAIHYVVNGRSSASYALDIKADAVNPGGITAEGKTIVSHIKPSSNAPSKDRPITRFYGGVFNASYVVKQGGNGLFLPGAGYTGASAPYFQFYGGVFNGTIYLNRSQTQFHGGVFNGSIQMSVDSSAYGLVAGGTFKNLSNSMGSTLNSDKFTIGSAKGVYDKEVYIDDNGNYVIAATEPSEGIEADVAKIPGTNDYLYYSKVKTEGQLGYTDVKKALKDNKSGEVTVYVDEIDMEGINFTGTIVVPEGNNITIENAPANGVNVQMGSDDPVKLTPNASGTITTEVPGGATPITDFASLKTALQQAGSYALMNNITVTEQINISQGTEVTLDLNGYKITASDKIYPINNDGILTINDSGEGGTIEGLGIRTGYTVNRSAFAELYINGGIFRNVYSEGAALYVHNGTVIINGGKFYGQNIAIANHGGNINAKDCYIDGYNYAIEAVSLTKINNATISGVCVINEYIAATNVTFYEARIGEAANYTSYRTLAEAIQASESGDVVQIIKEGSYDLPEFREKTLTFEGVTLDKTKTSIKDYVNKGSQGMTGSTVNFKNLTINGANENYYGLFHTAGVTYTDCSINGLRFLYSPTTFTNCAFNANGVEHSFWTYGASNVTVTGCTFTYTDRAVNCYSENGANHELDITFSDCDFVYAGSSDEPAGAVEINSSSVKSMDVAFTNDCTAPEKGAMWYISKWDADGGDNTIVQVNGVTVFEVLPVAKIGDVEYKKLQKAINAAQNDETITLLRDCGENVTITQKADVKFTIDGAQQTMTGAITVDGKSATIMSAGVTIKNVKFNANNITTDAAINLGVKGDNNTRYTCNVTVDHCTFTGTGQTTAAVKSYTGGDKNLTITNCNVDNTMHSLAQVAGVDNVTITNTVVNSKNGINLNSSTNVEMTGCNFSVQGYAVRIGAASDGASGAITLENNILKTNNSEGDAVIVIRGNAVTQVDLSMEKNVVSGTTHISGTTEATNISADANYWGEGLTGPVVAEGSAPVVVNSYYTDEAREQLIVTALTLQQFVEKVTEGNGTYNGTFTEGGVEKNITVKVVPVSGDAGTTDDVRVPNRLQKYTNPDVYYAQYQRFSELTDVNISNVNFVFYPAAVTVTDAWNTAGATTTADNINGELQLLNTGSVLFENCSFEKMSVSPIDAATLSVTSSTFNGLDAYAIKDIKATTATITGTTFTGCNGGFWFNNAPTTLTVTDNTFTGTGRRGAIQFSVNGDYANTEMTVTGNTVTDEAAFLWQLNNTISNAQLNAILDKNNNTYETAFVEGSVKLHLQGEGTADNPYLINDISDLEFFRDDVNAGNKYQGKYVKLTGDINLAEGQNRSTVSNWEPIGTSSNPFKGTFDGAEKVVSNLNINHPGGEVVVDNVGFFGKTDGATIKNLTINNASVTGSGRVAAVVGNFFTGTMTNVHLTGNIQIAAYQYVGGLIGWGYATVENCSVTGDGIATSCIKKVAKTEIHGSGTNGYVGGICGWIGEGNSVITESSVKNVKITTNDDTVGGICGIFHYGNSFTDCTLESMAITAPDNDGYNGIIAGDVRTNAGYVNTYSVKVTDVTAEADGVELPALGNGSEYSEQSFVDGVYSGIVGNQNDAVAKIGDTKYYTIQAAVNAASEGSEIEVYANTTENVTIPEGAKLTIKFNENITLNGYILAPNADLTINDGTISNTNSAKSAVQINAGKLELNNVNITSARHAMRIEGTNGEVIATINGGTYKLHEVASQTQHVLNAGGDGSQVTVTINNGTFVGPKGTASDSGAAINVQNNASVTINGGDFSNGKNNTLSKKTDAELKVYGGTFDQDPTAYVAEGYTVQTNEEDKYEVFFPVAQIGTKYYSDLHEAMVAAKSGETVKLVNDVDLAGTEWEPVTFNGIFDGQDHTISNLTINKPGVSSTGFIKSLNGTFKNVTFTNPTVTGGENTAVVAGRAGGGAALAENITINGTIKVKTTHSGYARAGGIVGGWGYGNYKNITVDGGNKATSYIMHTGGGDGRYVAGIVGHADDVESYTNCTVKNITISGGWLCGGIAGPGPADDGLATGCSVENIDMGADYSGGMFGWYYGDGTIENSIVKDVTFTDGSENNGAIGGYSNNEDATVKNVTIDNVKNEDGKPIFTFAATIADGTDTYYYATLKAAFAAVQADETITLLADVNISSETTLKVNNNITLDLNGKTITGTDNNTASFALIEIQPGKELTVTDGTVEKNGKITLTATKDRDWNAYSSVISNQRGKLTVNGGTIEHLGGTDMAYAIDNLTNTGNQIAETIVNGGIIKSTYRAIRQFLNSSAEGVNNILTINGGTIEGANKSIWMQDTNANANPGTLTVGENAQLKGDVYLYVTVGSTSWPVEVSIAAAALAEGSEVISANVPAGYEVKEMNGVYGVYHGVAKINNVLYESLAEAATAAQNGETIELLWQEGQAPIAMNATFVGDKTITITGSANVDWSKGWLYVGRNGEGDGHVIFNNAILTSTSFQNNRELGLNVSCKKDGSNTTNDGKVEIINSNIQLDYLIGKGDIKLDNSTLNVYEGFAVGARPASETGGVQRTVTMDITNGSKVIVKNHNGMGLGYESNGIMNIDATSTFETTQSFLITANGTMNVNGGNVKTVGTLTNNGTINVTGESTLNIEKLEGSSIDLNEGAIVKNSTVGGNAYIAGNVIFRGDNIFNMITDYGDYYSQETPSMWTVEAGASLTLTKTDRYGLGYGDKVTVYGEIEDEEALTARASLTDEDASVNMYGGLVGMTSSAATNAENSFTATNAYLIFGVNGDKSFGNKPEYYGNYTFTFNNSVVTANGFKFYEDNGTSTVKFSNSDLLVNGVLMTNDASSSFTFENSVVLSKAEHNGTNDKNQNAGVMTLTNTQFTYSAAFTNVGTLNLDLNSKLTAPSVAGNGTINIDATDFDGNDICVISADMASFEGVINVVGAHYIKKNDGIYVTNTLQGTLTKAYTSATGYWGECGGNANESFVLRFYNDNTYMGQTSLKDIDNIIDGDVYVTWSIDLNIDPNAEGYWAMSWDIRPTLAMQPNRVEQWIDGVKVAECVVEPNWADNIFPVVAAVTGEDDVILSYVNNTAGATLKDAFEAGGNVTILRDFNLSETVTVPTDKTVVLDLNGKAIAMTNNIITTTYAINNLGTLTIEDSSTDKTGSVSARGIYNGYDAYGNNVATAKITIEGGTFHAKGENGGAAVYNYGIADIKGGKFTSVGSYSLNNQSGASMTIADGVEATGGIYNSGATLTVNGGKISNSRDGAHTIYSWDSNVTLKDGEIHNENSKNATIFADGTSEVNIVDGTFTIKVVDETSSYLIDTDSKLNISGGEFTGGIRVQANGNMSITEGTYHNNHGNYNVYEGGSLVISGGTFCENAKTFVEYNLAQGYALKELANGYYTVIQIAGTQTREFAYPGWYWFSTYIQFENGEEGLDELQEQLGGNAATIKGQTAFTNYQTYNGNNFWTSGNNSLTSISASDMYMIKTTNKVIDKENDVYEVVTVSLDGGFVDYENYEITLKKGWNWIGYPLNTEVNVKDALAGFTPENGDQIKGKAQGSTSTYMSVFGGWFPDFEMIPGEGYMYLSNALDNKPLIYKGENRNGQNVKTSIENNHWIVDEYKYPNNMTVTAMLSIDGEIVKDNYEVAAFANGECRGSARPIYIEALDAYMLFMTIQGEDVENLTFKYYDVNYGTEYELNNTMVYSNDAIVGTIEEPYMFNLGILNIDESSVENISIYPNPTTTGKEINLQAMCDKVEVFNALGVKVAEYTNVDSIDAIETAGIYVIRVTIDGNARNCRLIVR